MLTSHNQQTCGPSLCSVMLLWRWSSGMHAHHSGLPLGMRPMCSAWCRCCIHGGASSSRCSIMTGWQAPCTACGSLTCAPTMLSSPSLGRAVGLLLMTTLPCSHCSSALWTCRLACHHHPHALVSSKLSFAPPPLPLSLSTRTPPTPHTLVIVSTGQPGGKPIIGSRDRTSHCRCVQ